MIQDGADMQGDGNGSEMQKKTCSCISQLELVDKKKKDQSTRHKTHDA